MDEDSRSRSAHSSNNPEPPSTTSEKHKAPSPATASQEAANAQANKRRRGLGVVTPNACTECRKKRAKCDGKKPCGRCKAQKDVECVYEVPVRQSKENLRSEIDQLRRQQRQNESVFSALARPELWEDVLARLRNGQSIETISEWVNGGLPSGGGTLPPISTFGQATSFGTSLPHPMPKQGPSGVTLPPLSGMGYGTMPSTAGGFGPMGHSGNTGNTQPAKYEYEQNSPWALSSQSQTHSNRSNSHSDLMQWTAAEPGPHTRVGSWVQSQQSPSSDESRNRGFDQVFAPFDSTRMKVPPAIWTNVTTDTSLVQHLLALYFCWEYPTFASLSKEHFLKDFLDGRYRYCSPILVNALLALGCRFSTQPNTRANPDDPYTSGDHFFKESLRLMYRETNHHNLTTIQALGIMSIREASCGRDSESWYYAGQSVRLATEMGLHHLDGHGDEDELAVQAATFWGAFALDHAWSLATGSLPQCSCFPHLPPKPAIIDDIEASLWVPYTDDGSDCLGAPLQRSCEQPSNVRSVYKCFCELSELVHQSLYVLHSPGRPVGSRDLLNIYTQYLNWYDRIPEVLRLGHNFTPAVLFAHMYYHFAILLLFRPLIKLRIIGSSILPRDVCSQAADAIQGLLRSYSQLYTLRRTPSFVPYFVLTSTIMHLAIGASDPPEPTSPAAASTTSTAKPDERDLPHGHPKNPSFSGSSREAPSPDNLGTSAKLNPRVAESLRQGIADLAEMAPCHHFAEQALNILRYLAKKWNIEISIPRDMEVSNDAADNLVRLKTNSMNFFAPMIVEDDFVCKWGTRNGLENAATQGPKAGPVPSAQPPETATGNGESPSSSKRSGPQEGDDSGMGGVENTESDEQAPREGVLTGGPASKNLKSTENPLFWPFPMQGRPMLSTGELLEEAGFAPL